MTGPQLIFDFDSTLVTLETLEALAELSLAGHAEAEARRRAIADLTERAMSGEIDFGMALTQRLQLLEARREHVEALSASILDHLTPSVVRNLDRLRALAPNLHIVSGGFDSVIAPVAAHLGVPLTQVHANALVYDKEGRVVGVDPDRPTARAGGKADCVAALGLEGEVVMIGDGMTDAEVRDRGAAHRFHAFTEVVARPRVMAAADLVSASIDEVLSHERPAPRFSFPRERMKVLLLEAIHPLAAERFRDEGYQVETAAGALSPQDLAARLADVSILGLRSKSELTAEVLAQAPRLLAAAAYCIGTNQIDLAAAAERGVAVFNAPYSNTRSVVELAIGLTIALYRGVADKSQALHQGIWRKSAEGARELRGKTLGIIGYGAIGSQLSVLAEALGMRVVFYDLAEKLALGNARRLRSLRALIAEADVISLHVDGRAENRNLISAAELAAARPGALLLNLSRGHVVDIGALAQALGSGRLAGAAIDVFPEEPRSNAEPFESPLQGLANVILTPHIGGSTEEAQEAIAEFATERLLGFIHRGDTTFSCNLPNVQLPEVAGGHRLLHIHRNQPGVLAALNRALAEGGFNVVGQHLRTDETTGYVIVDVEGDYDRAAVAVLKAVPGTVRFRALY